MEIVGNGHQPKYSVEKGCWEDIHVRVGNGLPDAVINPAETEAVFGTNGEIFRRPENFIVDPVEKIMEEFAFEMTGGFGNAETAIVRAQQRVEQVMRQPQIVGA